MFEDSYNTCDWWNWVVGKAFIEMTLSMHKPKKIIVFSRDEMKQWDMAKLYEQDPRVRFFIGCVRDRERLHRALNKVDYVVHAAATKIVSHRRI